MCDEDGQASQGGPSGRCSWLLAHVASCKSRPRRTPGHIPGCLVLVPLAGRVCASLPAPASPGAGGWQGTARVCRESGQQGPRGTQAVQGGSLGRVAGAQAAGWVWGCPAPLLIAYTGPTTLPKYLEESPPSGAPVSSQPLPPTLPITMGSLREKRWGGASIRGGARDQHLSLCLAVCTAPRIQSLPPLSRVPGCGGRD